MDFPRPTGRRADSPRLTVDQAWLETERARIEGSAYELQQKWSAGELWWLLDANQLATYHLLRAACEVPYGGYLLWWARRVGKTRLAELYVMEQARRHKGRAYKVAAASEKALEQFVFPEVTRLLETCPPKLRPRIGDGEMVYHHEKRSEWTVITLAGCHTAQAVERLRGPTSWGNIIEEAGTFPMDPGLAYVRNDVLGKQLQSTEGWEIVAGTPAKEPDHEYDRVLARAEVDGSLVGESRASRRTLFDNPRMSARQVDECLRADARRTGMSFAAYLRSSAHQREDLANRVRAVEELSFPDFTDELAVALTGTPTFRPGQIIYTAGDYGFLPHPGGVISGWYDALDRVYWVAEEEMVPQATGSRLVEVALRLEKRVRQMLPLPAGTTRVMDAPEGMLGDMWGRDGFLAMRPRKEHKASSVSDVGRAFQDRRIRFVAGPHGKPRTPLLIEMLKSARTKPSQTQTVWLDGRIIDGEGAELLHHYELVDDLLYAWRRVLEDPDVPQEVTPLMPDQAAVLQSFAPQPESLTGWEGGGWEVFA